MRVVTILVAAALSTHGVAWAETARAAAAEYETIGIQLRICRQKHHLSEMKVQLGEVTVARAYQEHLACQQPLYKRAKATYSKVLGKLKTASAKNALKDYQAALASAIENSAGRAGEPASLRQARQQAEDDRRDQLWQRLQLEL